MPYTRRRIKSMADIDREQARIKKLSHELEKNWSKGLLDQGLLFSAAMSLLGRKKNANKAGASSPGIFSSFIGKKKKNKKQSQGRPEISEKRNTTPAPGINIHPKIKKAAGAAGISFLRWQAFNLAWFLGKKAYRAIDKKLDEKKQERRLRRNIRKTRAALTAAAAQPKMAAKKINAAL